LALEELPSSAALLDFFDIHVYGREAGLRKAVAVSPREITLEDVRPVRVTGLVTLLQLLSTSTHVIVQSHGVGGTKDDIVYSEAKLSNGFEVEATELTPMPHLRFLMLAACYQGRHLPEWRRVAPNATLVLADGGVHPDDFSKTIVDIIADAKLDGRAPTAARTEELFDAHRDRRWRICEPKGDR
ncbi:MAG: hypothetical protein V4737_16120, partial [Curtobacterium sp.]